MKKNFLLIIPYFFLWVAYWFLTLKERNEYIIGKSKNMHCTNSFDSSRIVYGYSTTYEFDKNKNPTRNYITWKEFWQKHYFNK